MLSTCCHANMPALAMLSHHQHHPFPTSAFGAVGVPQKMLAICRHATLPKLLMFPCHWH